MVAAAIVAGVISGRIQEVSAAMFKGTQAAVELCLTMAGIMCLWTGVMEIMKQSGLASLLARALRPAIGFLFPQNAHRKEVMEAVSANMSANILGLGNAATPYGVKAAGLMADGSPRATDDLCMLAVVNSASLQLIPATVAALRAGIGSQAPYDILPAVLVTTAAAAFVGISACRLFAALGRRRA